MNRSMFYQEATKYQDSLRYGDRSLYASKWIDAIMHDIPVPDAGIYKLSKTGTLRSTYKEANEIHQHIIAIADKH